MTKRFLFISGLPRSGSTLLSAILRQNPDVYAGISSPVGAMMQAAINIMGSRGESYSSTSDEQRRSVLTGILEGYYRGVNKQHFIFDTNRVWSSQLALLDAIVPDLRVICCVRPIEEVIESFERITSTNVLSSSRIYKPGHDINVYQRARALESPDGVVGSAYAGVKQAFFGSFRKKVLFVPYRRLVSQTKATLESIYSFMDIPAWQHDFDSVEFDFPEFDAFLGAKGLHSVPRGVQVFDRESTLPPDLRARLVARPFWLDTPHWPEDVNVIAEDGTITHG
jgi:sulfotransferase